jgi:hypothetical protein
MKVVKSRSFSDDFGASILVTTEGRGDVLRLTFSSLPLSRYDQADSG